MNLLRGRRICLLIDSLGHGGAERMLVSIATELAAREWEVRVDVLTDRVDARSRSQLTGHGVAVHSHGFTRTFDLAGWRRLDRSLRSWGATVLHTQLEAADMIGGLMSSRWGPVVSTQHVFGRPEGRRAAMRSRLHHSVLQRRAQAVIAVSSAGRRHLVEQRGYSDLQVVLVHNGIATLAAPTAETRRAARQQLGLDGDDQIVMCCAVLRPAKGIEHLIDALERLPAELKGARLVVLGDGPHRASLEAHVQTRRVGDYVSFAGYRDDAVALLAGADVFAHPTLEDVFPTSVIEAMASSLPIVASRTGGVPELVDDGSTGVLVAPGDPDALAAALAGYLTDATRRQADGAAGRLRFEQRFTLDQQVDHLEELYERVTR